MKNNPPCEKCITLAPCKVKMRDSIIDFLSWAVSKCPQFREYVVPGNSPHYRLNVDLERLIEAGRVLGFGIEKQSKNFRLFILEDKK